MKSPTAVWQRDSPRRIGPHIRSSLEFRQELRIGEVGVEVWIQKLYEVPIFLFARSEKLQSTNRPCCAGKRAVVSPFPYMTGEIEEAALT